MVLVKNASSAVSAVFVMGFDFGTPAEALKKHFGACGTVEQIDMQAGKAVVHMATAAQAATAVRKLNKSTIPGNSRYIDVQLDKKSLPPKAGGSSGSLPPKKRPLDSGTTKVYVRGFDFDTATDVLEAHMGQVGTVEEVKFVCKGSANVTYSSAQEATAAVETLQGTTIEGNSRYIDVILGGDLAANEAGSSRVVVRGCDFGTTAEVLEAHMGQACSIVDIKWVTNGSANVTYSSATEATTAAQTLQGTTMEGNSRFIDVIVGGDRAPERAAKRFKGQGKGAPNMSRGDMEDFVRTMATMMGKMFSAKLNNNR